LFGVFQSCGVFINPSRLNIPTGSPRLGDGSNAPSLGGLRVDGSPVPLGSTATHDPTGISESPVGEVEVP
jgi:hypothetical protein